MTGASNEIREEEPGLVGIGTTPHFAIGQRALLVRTPGGNVLWDATSLIDDDTIAAVRALGGINEYGPGGGRVASGPTRRPLCTVPPSGISAR